MIAKRSVDEAPIQFNILVYQDVSEADHPDPFLLEGVVDQSIRAEQRGHVTALLDTAQLPVGDDVIAEVDNYLYRQLQEPLCTAVAFRVGEKLLEAVIPIVS